MHIKNPSIDHGRKRYIVEEFCTISPHVDRAILAQALVVEAIHLRDLSALMVASDESDAVGISHLWGKRKSGIDDLALGLREKGDFSSLSLYLEGHKKKEGLNRVEASIHKIAQEKIVCLRAIASNLEELFQIVELAMDVTTNLRQKKETQAIWGRGSSMGEHCP